MADQRLTDRTAIVTPADNFWVYVVDPNTTVTDPEGDSFKMTRGDFLGALFAGTFDDLTDTPNTKIGNGLKQLRVNAAENGIEYAFTEFLTLVGVDETTFTSKAGNVVTVNGTEDALFFTVNSFINLSDVSTTTLFGQGGKSLVVIDDLSTQPATQSIGLESRPTYSDLYGANGIVDGGITYRGSGLDYTVWGNEYIIDGTFYDNRPISREVTNDIGGALDRFDVYYIEINGTIPSVGILKGTEAASPVEPTLDLSKQVKVSVRLIAAGELVDPNAVTEEVYNDNLGSEWTNTLLPAGASLDDIVDPKVGTKSISLPAYVTPSVLAFQKTSMFTYVSSENLPFYIKVGTTFAPQASLNIRLENSVSGEYWNLTLTPQNLSSFGYDNSTGTWSLIQIPLNSFSASSRNEIEYDTFRLTLDRTPVLNLDWIVIQGGVPNPSNIQAPKFVDGDNPNDAVYLDGAVGIGRSNPFDGVGNEGQLELYSPEPIPVRNLTRINFKSPHYSDAAAIGGTAIRSLLTELLVTDTGVSLDNGFLTTPGIKTAAGTGTKIFLDNGTLADYQAMDDVLGWGFYADDEVAGQTITTTPTKLVINGLGTDSDSDYLPKEIRGISELWDTATNKITPISLGDGYTLRLDLEILSETGNPTELTTDYDIGGGATPTNVIVESFEPTGKNVPYTASSSTTFFSKATFLANGGQIFLSVDVGSVTLGKKQISIHRISKGTL